MLGWALTFFIVAVIAGALGFSGMAASMAGIAQILFYLFVALFVISLILNMLGGRKTPLVR